MLEYIYVHIDITSNAVLSRGITHQDFTHSVVHQPKNLLLLNASSDEGEYEKHSGLNIIRGAEYVNQYFSEVNRNKIDKDIRWIDFTDISMLKELTPLEISELLYFGHMKTSLHSPFFYKLQNDFVFLGLLDQMTRVYYRHIEEFYRILADKLTRVVFEKVNDRKTFFKRSTPVEKLNEEIVKELKSDLREGIVFGFNQVGIKEKEYQIPIYIVEDSLWKIKNFSYQNEPLVGMLIYNTEKQMWRLTQESDIAIEGMSTYA